MQGAPELARSGKRQRRPHLTELCRWRRPVGPLVRRARALVPCDHRTRHLRVCGGRRTQHQLRMPVLPPYPSPAPSCGHAPLLQAPPLAPPRPAPSPSFTLSSKPLPPGESYSQHEVPVRTGTVQLTGNRSLPRDPSPAVFFTKPGNLVRLR